MFIPIDLGDQKYMRNKTSEKTLFYQLLNKQTEKISLSQIIEGYESEMFGGMNKIVFKSQVHESKSNAIKIGDSHYSFTNIRVASIAY